MLWGLAKLVLAARETDAHRALKNFGVELGAGSTVFDLAAHFTEVCDRGIANGVRTDISEMAQLSAVESLAMCVRDHGGNQLFGSEDIIGVLRDLGTTKGYSSLVREFFARFTGRFLTYHLSREISNHVGANQRFADPADCTAFVDKISTHSRNIAVVLDVFPGKSLSKRTYVSGYTKADARDFAYGAITKIAQMLAGQEALS